LVPEIYASLLRDQSFSKRFSLFVDKLRLSAQLTILQLILLDLPIKYSSIRLCDYPNDSSACTDIINGAATLLSTIIGDRLHFKEEITDWLAKGRFAAAFPVGINRAIVATYDNENGGYAKHAFFHPLTLNRCTQNLDNSRARAFW
jgi:telomere length regulation protein